MSAAQPSAGDRELSSRAIVGQLASPVRLRVVAALVLGARTPSQISEQAGLRADQTTTALSRLQRSGLVATSADGFVLRESAFAAAARADSRPDPPDPYVGLDASMASVLRRYLVDGRLTAIPVAGRKRRAVLEYLACAFEPGQRYTEQQVNAIVRAWHDDVAALRRYLVDESLLAREAGQYWRIGGWLELS